MCGAHRGLTEPGKMPRSIENGLLTGPYDYRNVAVNNFKGKSTGGVAEIPHHILNGTLDRKRVRPTWFFQSVKTKIREPGFAGPRAGRWLRLGVAGLRDVGIQGEQRGGGLPGLDDLGAVETIDATGMIIARHRTAGSYQRAGA